MFSVSSYESFEHVIKLRAQVSRLQESPRDFPVVLLGNKSDLSERQVSEEEGQRLANALRIIYYEISLRENDQLEEMFCQFLKDIERYRSTHMQKRKWCCLIH